MTVRMLASTIAYISQANGAFSLSMWKRTSRVVSKKGYLDGESMGCLFRIMYGLRSLGFRIGETHVVSTMVALIATPYT